jgi:hypothetical protein
MNVQALRKADMQPSYAQEGELELNFKSLLSLVRLDELTLAAPPSHYTSRWI